MHGDGHYRVSVQWDGAGRCYMCGVWWKDCPDAVAHEADCPECQASP